jgi:hypothetical protein
MGLKTLVQPVGARLSLIGSRTRRKFVLAMAAAPLTLSPVVLSASPAAASGPSISAVYFSAGSSSPTITVIGSGFGAEPPGGSTSTLTGLSCGGNNGDLYGQYLWLQDNTGDWSAGLFDPSSSFSYIGIVISSYSDTKIVYSFGACYNSYVTINAPTFTGLLSAGDSYTMNVRGTSVSGTVEYPSVDGVSLSLSEGSGWLGGVSRPIFTVTGSGFGTLPGLGTPEDPSSYGASCSGDLGNLGDDYGASLYLQDNSAGWAAGEGAPLAADPIGLSVINYTDTQIVFTLGGCYPSDGVLSAGDAYTMNVLGASFSGTVAFVTAVSFSGRSTLSSFLERDYQDRTDVVPAYLGIAHGQAVERAWARDGL